MFTIVELKFLQDKMILLVQFNCVLRSNCKKLLASNKLAKTDYQSLCDNKQRLR